MPVLEATAMTACTQLPSDNATEAAIAQSLANGRLNRRLRYVHNHHSPGWMEYDGTRWTPCPDQVPLALQIEIRRAVVAGLEQRTIQGRDIHRLESHHGMRGVARLLSAWPTMHLSEELDPPNLLSTPSGIIDLRTNERLPHTPDHPGTACTTVDPGPACELWTLIEGHLIECLGPGYDAVHRFLGSSLLGLGADRKLAWLTGTGGDGKSTLAKVLRVTLGDYAATIPAEVFQGSSRGAHLHELGAGLSRARLAFGLEVGPNLDWPRIKGLSGGDEQVTKRLYGRSHTFSRPPCLLLIANDMPAPPDNASAERIIVGTLVPPVEPEERLMTVLKEDCPERAALAGACLSWLLRGCADFRAHGLGPAVPTAARSPESLEAWWDRSVADGHLLPGAGWTPLEDFAAHVRSFLARSGVPAPPDRVLAKFLLTRVGKRRDKDRRRYHAALMTPGDAAC